MKRKELLVGILIGLLTSWVGDWIWEQRGHVVSWIQGNPIASCIVLMIFIVIGCCFMVR